MNKYSRYYQRLYTGGWKCGKNICKKLNCVSLKLLYIQFGIWYSVIAVLWEKIPIRRSSHMYISVHETRKSLWVRVSKPTCSYRGSLYYISLWNYYFSQILLHFKICVYTPLYMVVYYIYYYITFVAFYYCWFFSCFFIPSGINSFGN